MGYDGAGGYTRSRNFSADASANIRILASAMDQELDDFASAMGLALLRDGQAAATNDIPMGGNRLTNVGGPTSASNYTRASEMINNVPIYMIDAESSTDRISVSAQYFTTASAGMSPAGGVGILVKMGSDKGSAPAIYLNTGDGNPHSANVVMNDGSAMYSGAIVSGGIYEFIFASAASVWHLMNPSFRIATTDTPGIIEIATTAEVDNGTDTSRAVTPATLAAQGITQATTASAGFIEIATTAEVTAGADTTRAVTPAALAAMTATTADAGFIEIATTAQVASAAAANLAVTPAAMPKQYGMVAICALTTAATTAKSQNTLASAWSVSKTGAGTYQVTHNLALTSSHAVMLQLTPHTNTGNIFVQILGQTTEFFRFQTFSASGGPTDLSSNMNIYGLKL